MYTIETYYVHTTHIKYTIQRTYTYIIHIYTCTYIYNHSYIHVLILYSCYTPTTHVLIYIYSEKRAAPNKEYLVEVTEEAIVGQVTVFNSKRDSIDDDKGEVSYYTILSA